MTDERPVGQPAAGPAHGIARSRYAGTPIPRSVLRAWAGDEEITVRHVAKDAKAQPVDPWTTHAREVAYRLATIENEAVEATLTAAGDRRTPLLTFRADYVGTLADARVWISLLAKHQSLAARLASAPTPNDAQVSPPWRLPLASPKPPVAPALLVWRCEGVEIEAGFLVVELLRDALGVADPARVRIAPVEAAQAVINTRQAQAQRRGEHSIRNARVLGSCGRCGRDLRDPTYAAIGLGPECIKSYPSAQVRARRELEQALRGDHHVHLNAKRPTDWLNDVRRRWDLEQFAPSSS